MKTKELSVGDVVTGVVTALDDKLYCIRLPSGHQGHLPSSELSWTRPRGTIPPELIPLGRILQLKIINAKPSKSSSGQHFRFSAKALVPDPWQTVTQIYPVGTRVCAAVSGFTSDGAYLDLPGGLSMFIHNSEVTWKDTKVTAEQQFSQGDYIEVIVIESSASPKRLAGSHREALRDPWLDFAAQTPEGTVFDGVITSVVYYGAFVRLSNGFVGLIHESQTTSLSNLSEGATVRVSVISIDPIAHRVALTLA